MSPGGPLSTDANDAGLGCEAAQHFRGTSGPNPAKYVCVHRLDARYSSIGRVWAAGASVIDWLFAAQEDCLLLVSRADNQNCNFLNGTAYAVCR